jgi:hypothetical protein
MGILVILLPGGGTVTFGKKTEDLFSFAKCRGESRIFAKTVMKINFSPWYMSSRLAGLLFFKNKSKIF